MTKQSSAQKIVVFEQQGSGQQKIAGIRAHGRGIEITAVYDIDLPLPAFIDEPADYLPADFEADLVLDFLKHPDLSEYLAGLCAAKKIPVIASGKKTAGAITPFTCCGLGRLAEAGPYGEQFGLPEFEVDQQNGVITSIRVRRGAPCSATWEVLQRIVGLSVEEALPTLAREVQYICKADPSRFDPVSGKSPLHYAGKVHIAALRKALGQESE